MKISRPTLIRIILWLSLIVFMIINLKISYKETLQIAIMQIIIPFAFLIGIGYLSYKIIRSIFQSINNRTSGNSNELVDDDNFCFSPSRIVLSLNNETRYIDYEEIVRCEADNNYTIFYLSNNEKVLVSKPLKGYSDLLTPKGFVRTHQSHLVNPAFVKSWLKEDGGILLLTSGEKIPVSKPNKEMVKLALQQL